MISQRFAFASALAASLVAWAICDVSAARLPQHARVQRIASFPKGRQQRFGRLRVAQCQRPRFHGAGPERYRPRTCTLVLGLDDVGGQIDVFQRH